MLQRCKNVFINFGSSPVHTLQYYCPNLQIWKSKRFLNTPKARYAVSAPYFWEQFPTRMLQLSTYIIDFEMARRLRNNLFYYNTWECSSKSSLLFTAFQPQRIICINCASTIFLWQSVSAFTGRISLHASPMRIIEDRADIFPTWGYRLLLRGLKIDLF